MVWGRLQVCLSDCLLSELSNHGCWAIVYLSCTYRVLGVPAGDKTSSSSLHLLYGLDITGRDRIPHCSSTSLMLRGHLLMFRWRKAWWSWPFSPRCERVHSMSDDHRWWLPGRPTLQLWPRGAQSCVWNSFLLLLLVMRMASHLSGLNCISHLSLHSWSRSRSRCRRLVSLWLLMTLYNKQSSANRHAVDNTHSGRSLM